MDVNNTRYHMLLGRDDWLDGADISRSGTPEALDLCWDEERGVLQLCPLLFNFPASPGDRLPRLEDRRGAACDCFGNWYWIAEDRLEIRFLPAGRRQAEHFWSSTDPTSQCPQEGRGEFQPSQPPAPASPLTLSGLTVTHLHYLAVGVLDPAGLLVFDLHGGGAPLQICWPDEVPFEPIDMAAAPGGGLWILDRQPLYWAVDRHFRVLDRGQMELVLEEARQPDFEANPAEPSMPLPVTFPSGIRLESASPIEARRAVSLESLPDGSVLILESDPEVAFSVVSRYRFAEQIGSQVSLDRALEPFAVLSPETDPEEFALRGHDMAFLPDHPAGRDEVTGTLFIAASDGNQAFAFRLAAAENELSLQLLPRYLPMRLFGGKALAACGKSVFYDLDEQWLPLSEQPRRRYRVQGDFTSRAFDARQPGSVWHRLFLDACIPPDTEVRVQSRSADLENLLPQMQWQDEPGLYLRQGGSELPYTRQSLSAVEQYGDRAAERQGSWEVLLQRARGRFLQLRLTLIGNQLRTPQLEVLRVYYPRFSYLNEYLPAVYRRDETSAFFLDRFLANLEGFYTVLEGRIAEAQLLFDARTAPEGALPWLAGWLGVVLDPAWDEPRRRLFLRHALELFNQRGTLGGLIRAVRLAVDPCPDDSLFEDPLAGTCTAAGCSGLNQRSGTTSVRVLERFLTRDVPAAVYGDPEGADQPLLIRPEESWTPALGAEALHLRWQQFLRERYTGIGALNLAWEESFAGFGQFLFPPLPPGQTTALQDWRDFIAAEMDFPYAEVTEDDASAYRNFLARRYRDVQQLNTAYQLPQGSRHQSFSQVQLPSGLPASGSALFDWIQFVSLEVPIRRNAHQFTVLVPVDPGQGAEAQSVKLALVERIVELEKPAHTGFEVKPFWALFRVGEARVAMDTSLGPGSRFGKFSLGRGALAEDYLW